MSKPSIQSLRELFETAMELPPAERVAFLDSVSDPSQAMALRRMLVAEGLGEALFERPAPSAGEPSHPRDAELDLMAETSISADGPRQAPNATTGRQLTGRVIHGYEFLECIGEGGFGAVYRARQLNLRRHVAIKVIKPDLANDADFVRRFEAEAELVARLEHGNIVPLYDFWREPGAAYMVMRLLKGGSLSQVLSARARGDEAAKGPSLRILPILRQVAQALSVAHKAGVIHRDLKPANILLDEQGNACLADFGVAKQLNRDSGSSSSQEIVGSLAYCAPEQLQGATVTPATDVYALATMTFELLAGRRPFLAHDAPSMIAKQLHEPPPVLSELVDHVPMAVNMVMERGLSKEAERRPQDAISFVAELEAAFRGVEPGWKSGAQLEIGDPVTTVVRSLQFDDGDNPYLGLAAFDEGDARNFFGREALIKDMLERLDVDSAELKRDPQKRALFIVGASGSGKSSLARAGLVPALRSGAIVGSRRWLFTSMVPGNDPFESLAGALNKIAVQSVDLLELLRSDSFGFVRAIERALPADADCELLLTIDQFEELFTQVSDETIRRAFISGLTTAILDRHSRLRLLATVRADFLDRPLSYPVLAELVRARSSLIPTMSLDELERAIVGPARRLGLTFEAGLVSQILDEVRDQLGALPLLQYALSELFRRRAGCEMKLAVFHEMGGVRGALVGRAEAAWQSLDADAQRAAQQILQRLTTLGEGREDTRRRALRSEIDSLELAGGPTARERAIEAFARERLLSFDRDDVQFESTIEVAHEALLRNWIRLREWLGTSRAHLRLQRQLAESAAQWRAHECDASFLVGGSNLEQFRPLLDSLCVSLTPAERAYLQQAIEYADASELAERARQKRELDQAQALAEQQGHNARLAQEAAAVARRSNRQLRVLIAGLVLILGFAFWQSARLSTRTKDLAQQTERANEEADSARALSDFWQTLFATADPNRSKGKDLSVRDVLDVGVKKVHSELNEAPVARARLLLTIGRTYRQLQLFDAAESALAGAADPLGADPDEQILRVEVMHERARLRFDQARFDDALALIEQTQALDGEMPVLLRATTLNIKAGIMNAQRNYQSAAELLDAVLRLRREHGATSSDVATTLNNMAFALMRAGELRKARNALSEALDLKLKELGEKHVETALMLLNLGKAERDLGDFAEADKHLKRANAVLAEIYPDSGNPHPAQRVIAFELAVSQRMQGNAAEAFDQLRSICPEILTCDLSWQREVAAIAIELKLWDVAETALKQCQRLSAGTGTARCDWRRAELEALRGSSSAAIAMLREAIDKLDRERPLNIERAQALMLLAELSPEDAKQARAEAREILMANQDYFTVRKLLQALD